jgi:general secretion pathway protein G
VNIFKKSKGFTLIEVIVVISIMAVLSVIIYASFDKSKAKSRDQKRISDISSIQLALEQYFNKYGVYPTVLSDTKLVPAFISEIPTPPNSGETYNYFPLTKTNGSSDCVSYQLWTTFEMTNLYLDQKKGFNSKSLASSGWSECSCAGDTACTAKHASSIVDASANANTLIYDVMP